ncbi:hypothetical protein A3731_28570 [Roseovarius sp. HI0049]|nr:hypothetical protein A3731_28570 [Roseovarius sp. HI0049]
MPRPSPRTTCTLDDLRDIETVLAHSGGEPVEILSDSGRVGHFVPHAWVKKHEIMTEDALIEKLRGHAT